VLLTLWVLLAIDAVGGLAIFFARLAWGATPGITAHVLAGCALAGVYVAYQIGHWSRVSPLRARLDYGLGVLAAATLVGTFVTGLVLAVPWWRARASGSAAAYPPMLSAVHNIGSMLVLTFVGAHLGAVLNRDRRGRRDP
jgi:hypothetical protein